MKKLISTSFLILLCGILFSQEVIDNGVMRFNEQRRPDKREIISIPDVNGYKVLTCDFHMHTVFSDGQVWPSVRLQEAWMEGIDAISFTEHVESHRYAADVKTDIERPHQLMTEEAKKDNMILIKGAEITRLTPPGHFNAIYVGDTKNYLTERKENNLQQDKEAILKASAQGAFIFWNHPGWKADQIKGSYEWSDFLDDLLKNNSLHGIEVFNGFGFHKKALDWCIDKNLTVIGTSDIHNLVNLSYDVDKSYVHRTMTLVLAKGRSAESIREALNTGRTVAWAGKYLAGKEENLRALFSACVELKPSHYTENKKNGEKIKYYEFVNKSDLYFEIELEGVNSGRNITLYPKSTIIITTKNDLSTIKCNVTTAFVRSDKNLSVNLPVR